MTGEIEVVKTVVPKYVVRNRKIYHIRSVHNSLITKQYSIFVDRGFITGIMLKGSSHPNCDPNTNLFCIPDLLKNIDITVHTSVARDHVERLLKTFYLDNCYFSPWSFIEWSE